MVRKIYSYFRNSEAAVAVEFALVLPALLIITVGSLELGLMLSNIHQHTEATRAAAREAIIQDPLLNIVFENADIEVCTGAGTDASDATYTCTDTTTTNNDGFRAIVSAATRIKPNITPGDITVSYVPSELDREVLTSGADTTNTATPIVRVTIGGNIYNPILISIIPGIGNAIDLPPATISRMSPTEIF